MILSIFCQLIPCKDPRPRSTRLQRMQILQDLQRIQPIHLSLYAHQKDIPILGKDFFSQNFISLMEYLEVN